MQDFTSHTQMHPTHQRHRKEGHMKYIVIHRFRDLQDNDKIYEVGDEYKGKKTKARIAELSSDKNRIRAPLIRKEEEQKE